MGLARLLPVSRQDHVGNDGLSVVPHYPNTSKGVLPLIAVLALSNLLVAAHPIMKLHSQKILTELLACMAHRRSREMSSRDKATQQLFLHVAGMTVVVCGDRAMSFLRELFDSPRFNSQLKNCVEQVQQCAKQLPKRARPGNQQWSVTMC